MSVGKHLRRPVLYDCAGLRRLVQILRIAQGCGSPSQQPGLRKNQRNALNTAGAMPRKEPDLTSIAKKLTGQKVECTTEMKHLLDCMLRHGILQADTQCVRQQAAALACMQAVVRKGDAKTELSNRLKAVANFFRRYGYR